MIGNSNGIESDKISDLVQSASQIAGQSIERIDPISI